MPNIISAWVGNSQEGMEVDGPIWVKFNFPLGAAEWFSDMIGQNYFVHSFALSWLQIRNFLRDIRGLVNQFAKLEKKIRGLNGVFWGRVGLFGINLHFCFGILDVIAGKRKQYLNRKENKKEEKGAQKTDTQTLWRPSVRDSARTWREWRRRTL